MKEDLFAGRTCGVAAEGAVGGYNAMAGDDYRYGVVANGCTDGLGRAAVEAAGNVAIGDGLSVGYVHQKPPYGQTK